MLSPRTAISAAAALLVTQVAVIARFGMTPPGPLLSDLIQLALGALCVLASIQALHRSGRTARHYWRWLTVSFGAWVLAQMLGTYIDIFSRHSLDPFDDLLFFFAVVPFGMLLFLDPDHEPNHFDRLHLLDFLQVCAFWGSVYLFFSSDPDKALTTIGWGPFGWTHSLVFNGVIAVSLFLRAVLTNSPSVRTLFGRLAPFLFLSALADSYASYAPNRTEPGQWFDLVWGALLGVQLLIAVTWSQHEQHETVPAARAQRIVVNQFFPLVFPFFSLMLLTQIALRNPVLSSFIIAAVFVAVGVRVLAIQHRLVEAQDTLEFEASHDSLTGLSNRRAILECLTKELERQKRSGDPVGLIIADADRFKTINDTHGHLAGDQVLREIARRLMATVRTYDCVGRYGGEEFLIVLPNCNGQDTFASAERLRESIARAPVATDAGPVPVTLSMGLISTMGCPEGLDCSMVLRMIDAALYQAKANGRNRIEGAFWWGNEPPRVPEPVPADAGTKPGVSG